VAAAAALALAALLPATQAAAVTPPTPVLSGHPVTGTVTDTLGAPLSAVCVYPVLAGNYTYVNGGLGGFMQQVLAGSCTGSDGAFSLTVPSAATQTASVLLAVAPQNNGFAGLLRPLSLGTTIELSALDSTVGGQVVDSALVGLPNWLVAAFDTNTGAVLGTGVTDSTGNFFVSIPVVTAGHPVVVGPLAPVGGSSSPDILANASAPFTPAATGQVTFLTSPLAISDFTRVTGHVTVDGSAAHTSQVVGALCQSVCTGSTYGVTDANGDYTFLLQRNASYRISAGGSVVAASTAAATYAVPSLRTVPAGATIKPLGSDPTTWLSPGVIVLTPKATWTWSGASLESGPDGWVRATATSTFKSALTAYSSPTWGTTQSRTVALAFGATQCLKVATVTSDAAQAAGFSGLPVVSCKTRPLDDRSLRASTGWKRVASTRAFAGTLTTVAAAKKTLTLTGVTGHRLSLVWLRTAKGGAFRVTVNGKLVATINTAGASGYQRITTLASRAMVKATVVITTTSAKPVAIDGLAVQP
jgi:hypothetical protein